MGARVRACVCVCGNVACWMIISAERAWDAVCGDGDDDAGNDCVYVC